MMNSIHANTPAFTWKPVALSLLCHLQRAGFIVDESSDGEDGYKHATNDKTIEHLTACDDAWLYVSRPFDNGGAKKLTLYIVWGNLPSESVCDCSEDEKLDEVLGAFGDWWSGRYQVPFDRCARTCAEVLLDNLVQAARDCLPDLSHYAATHGPGPDKRYSRLEEILSEIKI